MFSWKSLFLDNTAYFFFVKSTLHLEMFTVNTFEGKRLISLPHCTSLLPPVLEAGFLWQIEQFYKSFVRISVEDA